MKALVTAFALLSFVAASTIPYVASAAETQSATTTHKKTHKVAHKKHVKKAAHKKTSKKKPAAS